MVLVLREVNEERLRLGVHAWVFGECEADTELIAIIDCVVLAEEGVSENEQRTLWWWNVQGHQRHRAAILRLVDIVVSLQIKNVSFDKEAELWKLLVIGTIICNTKAVDQSVHDVCWASKKRGTSVDGYLALDALAEVLPGVGDGNILHLNLPVARCRDFCVEELACHALALVLSKCNLTVLLVSGPEEHCKRIRLQYLVVNHAVQDIESFTFRHLIQSEAEDSIKGHQAKWFVRLFCCGYEVTPGANGADANLVFHKHTTHLTRSEGDCDDIAIASLLHGLVRAVGKCNLDAVLGELAVEALVRGAGLIGALLAWEQQIATARIEYDKELLWWNSNCNLAVVLAGMHNFAVASAAPFP